LQGLTIRVGLLKKVRAIPFRWGILGTGYVARKFAHGLKASSEMSVAAVASRSVDSARGFADAFGVPAAFGSYDEAVYHADVDAFYIATPPSTHRDLALTCIGAGKPALIEKPFAADGSAARAIVEAAQTRNVFCMEAMWTRFLPAVRRVKALIDEGAIGEIRMLMGSFGAAEAQSPDNNLFNAALGGGALLDRAVYPISLAFHFLGKPLSALGETTTGPSGVDEQAAVILRYANGALASFTATLLTLPRNDFTIMGARGQIHLEGPIYRPTGYRVTPVTEAVRGKGAYSKGDALKESGLVQGTYQRLNGLLAPWLARHGKRFAAYYAGNGYHYEAEEVMRCVREGRNESALMPLGETLGIMETIDALRAQSSVSGA
jgi:predicted dehydrogenase